MNRLRIAIAQMNPCVGDLEANYKKIRAQWAEAIAQGAELVVFPECSLTGYPLEDLTRNRGFLNKTRKYLAKLQDDDMRLVCAAIVGCPYEIKPGTIYNSAWFIDLNGSRPYFKYELPNYGVFDEKRNFDRPALHQYSTIHEYKGFKLQIQICEDIWMSNVLMKDTARDAVIIINGSPWQKGKLAVRHQVIRDRQAQLNSLIPFFYVNMVGGQDEVVFDGASFIKFGEYTIQMDPWVEYVRTVKMTRDDATNAISIYDDTPDASVESYASAMDRNANTYQAAVLGLRDYIHKVGARKVVVGLSGGIDSALVAALAVDALGAPQVTCVRMPGQFSSEHSLKDAADLCAAQGIEMRTINITEAHKAYNALLPGVLDPEKPTVADENIQARIRGNILMAISNKEGHLVLSTSNKAEASMGYGTLFGDLAGGFNPLKDLYKTEVQNLCRWRNEVTEEDMDSGISVGLLGRPGEVIPNNIITKPPSAELATNQFDSDSLPPYEVLDRILEELVDNSRTAEEVVELTGFAPELVAKIYKAVLRNEYKRRMSPPGVKVSAMEFGREWRYPIINRYLV